MLPVLIFAPFAGFLINAFRFKSPSKSISGLIGSGACLISFLIALYYFLNFKPETQTLSLGSWISIHDLNLSFSFVLDSLSLLMVLLITGVGFLIHIYSMGYMSRDEGATRYFAYLNLFVFMMLILVLADSLPVLFVGWEGVGLCSYLLIGFWFKDSSKVKSGMKAFVVNRIGDACFLLGMFLIFSHFGSLKFLELNNLFLGENFSGFFNPGTLGALLLFLGATGKSAQIPLHIWLADAMAGPTPVSALIHAATMVTAGVYMIVRLFGFYSSSPDLLLFIGWIGAITSLGAALVATRQWDLKKVLAYSTISQLGYMFMALGVKAFSTGIFHLLTHGFFKALLFLCAGSLIHGLSGEQDIRFMGGLRKYFPKTFLSYMVGAFALVALPPFSGFFSKDEILHSLFSSGNYGLYLIALATAFCTAFYMTRLTVFVFFGKENFKVKPHESPFIMWGPLLVLSLLAFFGGFIGVPHVLSEVLPFHLPHFLNQFLQDFSVTNFKTSIFTEIFLMVLSVSGSLNVIGFTSYYYLKKKSKKKELVFWKDLLEKSFYIEEGLQKYIYPSFTKLSKVCFQFIDIAFFQEGILFFSRQVLAVRKEVLCWMDGNLQSYAFYFVMGLSVFLFLVFLR